MEKHTSVFGILRLFFGQYKRKSVILGFSLLIASGLETASVAIVYPILTVAFEGGVQGGTGVLSFFRMVAGILPISDEFIAFCLLFLILALMTFGAKLFTIRYRLSFSGQLVKKLQKDIFRKFVQADYQYFVEHKQGELIYNVISAPNGVQSFLYSFTDLLAQAILAISIFLLLLSLSWQGTIAVLLMGLIFFFFTRYLAERVSYVSGKRQAEASAEATVILNETINGIKQVKVFGKGNDWILRFGDTIETYWHHYIRRFTWQQALQPLLVMILFVFIGLTGILIRVISPDSFSLMIPVFGTFAFAVFRLTPVIGGVSNAYMQIMGSLPNCERVSQIIDEKLSHIEDGSKKLDSFKSQVKFENVTFTYKGRKKILDDVSITFEKGKTTAIVGRSGSGKTTIINLLLRLYDVDQGNITIDGLSIKDYQTASWLDKIGYVSQDTFIFNETIKNNITFGSSYTLEEIIKVAERANAHDFITELPDGYDTLVGDRGIKLSGGQRQRIAVARAMVRNPELLIFDEATNALDNISEAAVQKAIDEISKDHTVIVIAHRLSTVVNADKIIVLGDGRVMEEGTHQELMEKGGVYSELYRSQPV